MTRADNPNRSDTLIHERQGRLLILTLNRPDRLNALSDELHGALAKALAGAAKDKGIGAVALTGTGRAFCSGGDLSASPAERASIPTNIEEAADILLAHAEATRLLHHMSKPTIAIINGSAAGAGLALALACDLRIAGASAKFTTAYAKVAMSGDMGITYHLTRIVGTAKARELLFLSDRLSANDALGLGMVNRVEPDADVLARGIEIGTSLANGPSIAFRYMKQAINAAETDGLDANLELEAYNMARCGRTKDVREAVTAFREKRVPLFTGM